MHANDSEFPGARVLPDDPRYPTLVRGFNQRWVGHPRWVQVVGDAQQVVAIVQLCIDEKLRLTVRSGGHCYEGWVSENDGVIVDVSSLRAAGWDAAVMLPEFKLAALHVVSVAALPLLAAGIAAITARFTVLRSLSLMP